MTAQSTARRLRAQVDQVRAVAEVEGWRAPDEYEAFAAFVEKRRLHEALRRIDGNPENCRAFARGYNGTDYEGRRYHEKLAAAYRKGDD